jgi:hypothetical protein
MMADEQPPEDLGHAGAVVDKAIVHTLNNAIASVRSGELRGTHG